MNPLNPPKGADTAYGQLWRVIDGAVRAAFTAHPEYIPPGQREKTVRNSIVKRVTGLVLSFAEQSAKVRSQMGGR